MDKVLGRFNLE